MIIKKIFGLKLALSLFLSQSCAFFNKTTLEISKNQWSGLYITFADIDENYKRESGIDTHWKKMNKQSARPYYKFLDKSYFIEGTYYNERKEYLVIKDSNGKLYKTDMKNFNKQSMPNYLVTDDMMIKTAKMIGDTIWLNNTLDYENFFTKTGYNFNRFEPVVINGIYLFQNKETDFPIWFKISSTAGYEGFVRFNGEDKNKTGEKDHYFTYNPLPKNWKKDIVSKVLDRKVHLGMTTQQVKVSIGNPDKINSTSSRHGNSEQWIYKNGKKENVYFQFENHKLIYVNE